MAARVATDLILHDVNPTGKEIGRGAYGRVFEVHYQGTLCAAKEVHELLLQYSQGVYYPARDQYRLPVMVMEKMQDSLRGLVEKYANIPFNVKLSILDEVCLGLRYLHSRNPPIVHRDLTPNNILLGRSLEAKITDLGVTKVMRTDGKSSMTKVPGTPDFMPPESITQKPVYGPSLDVFSYGGVILNVITQQWPKPTDQVQLNTVTDRWEMVSEVTRRRSYLDMFTGSAVNLIPMVTSCLNDNPGKRPMMTQVSTEIKRTKDVCSQQTGIDRMSPIVWWAEVSGQSSSQQQVTSLTSQLEEMTICNEGLKRDNDSLKVEVDGLKVENNGLKVEVDGLNVQNNRLELEVTRLKAENQHLQHTSLMADQRKILPLPVHP
ncbi:receptor-interacting serine/threonine-protein kinase 4-like isoform X2 [Dysidea avara]|uniref:receptor-interacting serine/threonine-protein kinase 4-like isoform X2 n=1 Tax=Dysidea avara TaxID=196820 RepID=UPI00332D2407